VGGERGDHAVGADLTGVVHVQRDAGAHAGPDEHHRHAQRVQQLAQRRQQRRHRRACRDAGDLGVPQQTAPEQAQLVGRGAGGGGHAPAADPPVAVEGGEHGLAVADVDGQQHGRS
jgi:hypothetical protein